MAKIERPHIHQKSAVFSTRTEFPNEIYWKKLVRMIKNLNATKKSTFSFFLFLSFGPASKVPTLTHYGML